MPAKGSCCCVRPIGAATMWKVNVFTGEVVDAFPHNGTALISQRCAIDTYYAGETGLNNSRAWDRAGGLLWGPLSYTPTHRGKAFILTDYGEYIVGGSVFKYPNTSAQGYVNDQSPDDVEVYDISDGAEVSHSMTGVLIRCGADYIDTFTNPANAVTPQTATIRRYADDLSTLITSVTQASVGAGDLQSAALSEASYAVLGSTTLKVWEPSDLSLRFTVSPLPTGATGVTDDEQGGVYLYTGAANDRILKYSGSSTPDWDVTNLAYAIPRFGALGSIFSHNAATPALTKIDGSDGSIAWTCDYSSVSGGVAATFSEVLSTGHSGVVLLSNGSNGLVAIDDVYGSIMWFSENKGYGRPIPDGDSHIWVCGEYGT